MVNKEKIRAVLQMLKEHWPVVVASVVISILLISFNRVLGVIMALLGIIALAWLSGYRLSLGIKKKEEDASRPAQSQHENHYEGEDRYGQY